MEGVDPTPHLYQTFIPLLANETKRLTELVSFNYLNGLVLLISMYFLKTNIFTTYEQTRLCPSLCPPRLGTTALTLFGVYM